MKNPPTNPTLVIDGMSIFRSVAGPAIRLTHGYTYSFLTQITSIVRKYNPSGIIVCWEGGGYGKRAEVYPEYKSERSPLNENMRAYREQVKTLLTHLGVDQMKAIGYEADDLGAYLSNTLGSTILLSNDHDWLQLVKPNCSLIQKVRVADVGPSGRGKSEKRLITHENFSELTEWETPEEFVHSLMILGDKDECPGLPGIGKQTLIKFFRGHLRENTLNFQKISDFLAGGELYEKYKALVDIRDIKELGELELVSGKYDERAVKTILEELQFASILKFFPAWVDNYQRSAS